MIDNINVTDILISDHFPVTFNLNIEKMQSESKQISFRKFKSLDTDELCSSIRSSKLKDIHLIEGANSKATYFNECLQGVLDDLIPIQTKTVKIRSGTA